MGYDNEHTEILDIFEDVSYVAPTPIEIPKEDKKQQETITITNQKNKKISISIILLPIFTLIYIISTNSKELINERISIFSLIMIGIFTILLILGFIKESKLKRKKTFQILRFTTSVIYIGIFVFISFMLYDSDSKVKYFLVEKAMSTSNHHYLATWFYDQNTIDEVLSQIKNSTIIENSTSNKLNFDEVKEENTMYANAYEEEVLKNKNETYKKILLKGKNYQGYFLVIYNPSLLKLNTNEKIEIVEKEIIEVVEDDTTEENVIKNVLNIKDNKLLTTNNHTDTEYVEYKIIQNKSEKYQKEIILGQRADNIIMLLVIEENNDLKYIDIYNLFNNYKAENIVVVNENYNLQIDSNNITLTN